MGNGENGSGKETRNLGESMFRQTKVDQPLMVQWSIGKVNGVDWALGGFNQELFLVGENMFVYLGLL